MKLHVEAGLRTRGAVQPRNRERLRLPSPSLSRHFNVPWLVEFVFPFTRHRVCTSDTLASKAVSFAPVLPSWQCLTRISGRRPSSNGGSGPLPAVKLPIRQG